MKLELIDALTEMRAASTAAVVATSLQTGEQALIHRDGFVGDAAFAGQVIEPARTLLDADQSKTLELEIGRVFFHVLTPQPRLIIVGAVHIAEPLTRMAESAGYRVTLIDPRRTFAAREQFRGVELIGDWPDEAIARLHLDARSAMVALSHDPKLDDAALVATLQTAAFYVGCLGSRKAHAARLARLRARGLGEEALARIHGPVGLPIGACSPAEIAISVLAEMTHVRRAAGARSLAGTPAELSLVTASNARAATPG